MQRVFWATNVALLSHSIQQQQQKTQKEKPKNKPPEDK